MVGSNFVVAPAPKPSKAGRRDTSCRKQTTFLHASTLSPFLRLLQLYGHRLTRSDPLREPALIVILHFKTTLGMGYRCVFSPCNEIYIIKRKLSYPTPSLTKFHEQLNIHVPTLRQELSASVPDTSITTIE